MSVLAGADRLLSQLSQERMQSALSGLGSSADEFEADVEAHPFPLSVT